MRAETGGGERTWNAPQSGLEPATGPSEGRVVCEDPWNVTNRSNGRYWALTDKPNSYTTAGGFSYVNSVEFSPSPWLENGLYDPIASISFNTLSPVPEPSEWAAISFGLLGVVWVIKRRLIPARA